MTNDLLFTFKKHTDTHFQQTRTKPQTLKFTFKKQKENFSFNPPINLHEEGNWLLAVTSAEATNSVSNIIDENKSLPITTPCHWTHKGREDTIDKLNELSELRSQNDTELHVKGVERRSDDNRKVSLEDLDTFKHVKIEEL